MLVYQNGTWTSGYLDETPGEGFVRLSVHRQMALAPVRDQYFVRAPQVAMLANYLRALGPRRVLRKVISRRSEAARNDAWLSVGVGFDGDANPFGFVATSGPQGQERVVVHRDLTFAIPADVVARIEAGHLGQVGHGPGWSGAPAELVSELEPLLGWRPETETTVSLSLTVRSELVTLLTAPPTGTFETYPVPPFPPSPSVERVSGPTLGSLGVGFHCFGYGQYAKTQAIPNLVRRLRLEGVHEINSLQIGPVATEPSHIWDTSPFPREGELIANAVVAGYHHTHVPVAVRLMEQGARHVIIEKPVASSIGQLEDLRQAMRRHPEVRIHVAFQRRYSPFNRFILADIGPVVSLAATVYEVPLPVRHWYRWPVVGNAVVSNGCHWIDHFLFLNEYADVVSLRGERLASQIVLSIELANGASCSISLRHEGSPRLGVRDLCVFWSEEGTVTVEDARRYTVEKGFARVRHRSTHPYRSLEHMYREFGRRIALDLPGDPLEAIEVSAAATLHLAGLVDGE